MYYTYLTIISQLWEFKDVQYSMLLLDLLSEFENGDSIIDILLR